MTEGRQARHEAYMRRALDVARAAVATEDVPVGAVVFGPDGQELSYGHNTREATHDPTAHAEVVAVRAAAVNPVDVGTVAGRVEQTTLPRTLGHDFAGVVVEGPERLRGVEVWATGDNLGMTQDGTHAESVVIPASAVRPKPSRLSMEHAAAVGISHLVAWLALVEAARIEPGEVLLAIGVSGGARGGTPRRS